MDGHWARHVRLRACEPEDLECLYRWENDPSYHHAGALRRPFSRYILKEFIRSAGEDIYVTRQMRLMVDLLPKGETVGAVDLFDLDPHDGHAAVGILIDRPFQGKGVGVSALQALQEYAFSFLRLRLLYAHVAADNVASLRLFEKTGFVREALLRDWLSRGERWADVVILVRRRHVGR